MRRLVSILAMSDLPTALTEMALSALPLATHGQTRPRHRAERLLRPARQDEEPSPSKATCGRGLRKSIQLAVGRAGDVNARETRAKAREWLGKIASGELPTEERRWIGGPTLAEAWGRYIKAYMVRNGRRKRTIANLKDHMGGCRRAGRTCRCRPRPKSRHFCQLQNCAISGRLFGRGSRDETGV
jgi:hypothetical protein